LGISFKDMSRNYSAADLAVQSDVPKQLLLDTTFVSDYDAELIAGEMGPARLLARLFAKTRVFVSVVTIEEFYEKRGREAARELAARFSVLGLHVGDALLCGQLQSHAAQRLGENDAWLAAQALRGKLSLVSRDGRFASVKGMDLIQY
jgi:hypothetical protein